jgi:hypothetical protein
MCDMCLKQLRHEALEYFRCLYDHAGDFGYRNFVDTEEVDEDDRISEKTFKDIIALYECMKTHELLKQITEREEALYNRDQREKTKEHLEEMVEKWVVDEDIEEAKAKVKELHNEQQVKILKEELKTFLLNQNPDGWTKDQVELLTLDGLLHEVRKYAFNKGIEYTDEWQEIEERR